MLWPKTLLRNMENKGVRIQLVGTGSLEVQCQVGAITSSDAHAIRKGLPDLARLLKNRRKEKGFEEMINSIVQGNCLDVMKNIPSNSMDAIVTDPPFGLGFMNMKWDRDIPPLAVGQQMLRILKPGAFAVVMCSPRGDCLKKMIEMLESAGFITSFTPIFWTYADGAPKSKNISKSLGKKAGAENEVVRTTAPAPDEAEKLEGAYGSFQPKPAVEVILVVMKPYSEGTAKEQALLNGKGITFQDKCRIPYHPDEPVPTRDFSKQRSCSSGQVPASQGDGFNGDPRGRVGANLLVDDDVLDGKKQGPEGYSRYFSLKRWFDEMIERLPEEVKATFPFMIVPKANTAEKERGLEDFEPQTVDDGRMTPNDSALQQGKAPRKNTHPCIKPVKLMAYLVTMFSSPGDLIADPCSGTGSTCIAAKILGRRYIGIELEAEYCRVAEARLAAVSGPAANEKSVPKNRRAPNNGGKTTRVKKKKSDGAYDWAGKTINCCRGCTNNCRYCYARESAIRYRQIKNYDEWETCHIRQHDVIKRHRNYGELVMFPSTHDITLENIDACLKVLRNLLRAGNQVLIVSKPRLAVIRILCAELGEFRDNILFRLTITATDNAILSFWEPGAASYEERREALAYAKDTGYKTSVSVEPMLDADNIGHLIADLQPLVTETIWIGTMNHLNQIRVDSPEVELELARIRGGQTDERLKTIYNSHRENHVIRWKKEIRKVVGIEPPEEPTPASEGEVQNVN